VDEVVGDDTPTVEQLRELRFTTRVINESMRLYPQPPVLIRRYCAGIGAQGVWLYSINGVIVAADHSPMWLTSQKVDMKTVQSSAVAYPVAQAE